MLQNNILQNNMSQPSSRDIDVFRMKFYEQLITQEKKKENERALKQRNCYHRYQPLTLLQNGSMEWICSNCDRVVQRRISF